MDIIASDRNSRLAAWPMYRALVGVALLCGLLIVGVYLATYEVIAANRAAALQRAILGVLPGAQSYRAVQLEETVYAGFNGDGELVGVAVPTQAMGYQDVIRILYGYDPRQQLIVGMQVLESKETPGLGDKIEKDPVFRANFTALDVRLANDGQSLAKPIELVKPGHKTRPWQIDAISGATISSQAIASMLGKSSAYWVPELYQRRASLRQSRGVGDEP